MDALLRTFILCRHCPGVCAVAHPVAGMIFTYPGKKKRGYNHKTNACTHAHYPGPLYARMDTGGYYENFQAPPSTIRINSKRMTDTIHERP